MFYPRLWLLFSCLACLPATAMAHGTADNHLQIVVIEQTLRLNINVGPELLSRFESDGDGSMSLDELAQQRPALQAWLDAVLLVGNEKGDEPLLAFSDITSDLNLAEAHGNRIQYARIVRTLKFDEPPAQLRIDVSGLAAELPPLKVTIIDAGSGRKYRLSDPGMAVSLVLPR